MKAKDTVPVAALAVLIPIFFWFFNKIDSKADKVDVEKVEEEIDAEENLNIRQTTLLEGLTKTVNNLNKRIEKELAK